MLIRILCLSLVALVSSTCAQQPSTQATGELEAYTVQILPGNTQQYRSGRLKAGFQLIRLSIPGYRFFAAKIVEMDADSPLREVGLDYGDYVTRLDGVRISTGKWWDSNQRVWRLPQMERHYGRTQVRYVKSGGRRAFNGYTNLGPRWQIDGGWPLEEIVVP